MSDVLILTGIPIPPTSNHAYKRGRNLKDYPAEKMLKFQKEFTAWVFKNEKKLGVARNHISHNLAKLPNPDLENNKIFGGIKYARFFYFEKSEIYYQNGKRKKVDLTNRIKYLDDYLSKALGIDDSQLVAGSEELALDATSHVDVIVTMILW